MIKISNSRDLVKWYGIVHLIDTKQMPMIDSDRLIEIKRAIRYYTHKPIDEYRIVKDYGIDGAIFLFPLPEKLQSKNEATEYFEEYVYFHYQPSAYDCTGQPFTSWYKIFQRNGRFWAYHRVAMDV